MSETPNGQDWLWPGTRLRIARVLVDADGPLPGSEIARSLGADTSNVNKELIALGKAGLVRTQPPDPAEPPPTGRPSRHWVLDGEQRRIAAEILSDNPEPRRPPRRAVASPSDEPTARQGIKRDDGGAEKHGSARTATPLGYIDERQELVLAHVDGSRIVDLMAVLADGDAGHCPAWTALWGSELVFAFDGADPVAAALDLLAVLKGGAQLRVRRAAVSRVWRGEDFMDQARASTRKARAAAQIRDG